MLYYPNLPINLNIWAEELAEGSLLHQGQLLSLQEKFLIQNCPDLLPHYSYHLRFLTLCALEQF